MSPRASTSGCPGSERSGSTTRRPARSASTPARSASRPASGEAFTPAAQMTVRVGMRSVVSSARWTVTLLSSTATTDSPSRPVTPRSSSERSALAERLGGKVVRIRSSASTSRMRAVMGVDAAEIAAEVAPDLGDLARHLDSGGAGADHDEGQELGPAIGVGLELGRLEGLQDLPADRQRALQRLQLGRVLLPFIVAEVGVLRAAGDDQRVVLQGVGRGAQGDIAQGDPALRRDRHRRPRPGRRARCAAGGRCAAAGSRSPPARSRPWPPGRPAAGRGGSCADRRA